MTFININNNKKKNALLSTHSKSNISYLANDTYDLSRIK